MFSEGVVYVTYLVPLGLRYTLVIDHWRCIDLTSKNVQAHSDKTLQTVMP